MAKTGSAWPIGLAAGLTAFALAGCQTSEGTIREKPSHSQSAVVVGTTPSQLYADMGRKVRACWLNPADPVLTKHVFHAVATPDGSATNIVIHERAPDGRRGLKAFSIAFEPRRGDTRIVTANHRLPYALSQKLAADVGYWAQGGGTCNSPDSSRGSTAIDKPPAPARR